MSILKVVYSLFSKGEPCARASARLKADVKKESGAERSGNNEPHVNSRFSLTKYGVMTKCDVLFRLKYLGDCTCSISGESDLNTLAT